jgi:hypothetical protein
MDFRAFRFFAAKLFVAVLCYQYRLPILFRAAVVNIRKLFTTVKGIALNRQNTGGNFYAREAFATVERRFTYQTNIFGNFYAF